MFWVLDENGNHVKVGMNDPRIHQRYDMIEKTGIDPYRIAKDEIGSFVVSTVFLPIDHGFGEDGPPVLWETMVFSDPDSHEDLLCERYTSRQDAVDGHNRIVAKLQAGEKPEGWYDSDDS